MELHLAEDLRYLCRLAAVPLFGDARRRFLASSTVSVARFLNASAVTPGHAARGACVKMSALNLHGPGGGKDPKLFQLHPRLTSPAKSLPVFYVPRLC